MAEEKNISIAPEYMDLYSFKRRADEAINTLRSLYEAKLKMEEALQTVKLDRDLKNKALGLLGNVKYSNIENIAPLITALGVVPELGESAKMLATVGDLMLKDKQLKLMEDDKREWSSIPEILYAMYTAPNDEERKKIWNVLKQYLEYTERIKDPYQVSREKKKQDLRLAIAQSKGRIESYINTLTPNERRYLAMLEIEQAKGNVITGDLHQAILNKVFGSNNQEAQLAFKNYSIFLKELANLNGYIEQASLYPDLIDYVNPIRDLPETLWKQYKTSIMEAAPTPVPAPSSKPKDESSAAADTSFSIGNVHEDLNVSYENLKKQFGMKPPPVSPLRPSPVNIKPPTIRPTESARPVIPGLEPARKQKSVEQDELESEQQPTEQTAKKKFKGVKKSIFEIWNDDAIIK